MSRITQDTKNRIAALWTQGLNSVQIMERMALPEKTVLRYRPLSWKVRRDRLRRQMLEAPKGSSINLPATPKA